MLVPDSPASTGSSRRDCRAPAGASRNTRDLAPLAAGVYFLTAEIPGHRAGAKIIRPGG
jgi:hypothetical protein